MMKDRYEIMKEYVCDLIDLAKKHKLPPSMLVELVVLEGLVSLASLRLGKEIFIEVWDTARKHGYYVDKRINEVASRFDTIKKDVEKVLKEKLETP